MIDAEFRTERDNKALLGHSFGGYFVLYSLLDQLKKQDSTFKTFISGSQPLWYHNFYLNALPEQLANKDTPLNLFVSVGALEDSTWNIKPVVALSDKIQEHSTKDLSFQSVVYSHLDHMDVGVLSFIKGLQEFLGKDE